MTTKTHFPFRIDVWDDQGVSIVQHVAGVDDFETAVATRTGPRVGAGRRRRSRCGRVPVLSTKAGTEHHCRTYRASRHKCQLELFCGGLYAAAMFRGFHQGGAAVAWDSPSLLPEPTALPAGGIASSVEKWRRRTPPRYAALSLHAVTNFRP
jgi:hypothetical protein